MIYINAKTRVVIDSPTPISGGDWVLKDEEIKKEIKVEETKEEIKEEKIKEEDVKKEVEDDMSEVTKTEIMQELDALKIEYNSRMTKKELLELLQGK